MKTSDDIGYFQNVSQFFLPKLKLELNHIIGIKISDLHLDVITYS